jgi:hypothetical protein
MKITQIHMSCSFRDTAGNPASNHNFTPVIITAARDRGKRRPTPCSKQIKTGLAFQRVVLYAVLNPGGGGGGVAALPITMRTILPTVQKQQTSAGSWTSLVRQYTIVNAAQNSVNGKTLPSTEPPLGEFTRPEPPDSVSAPGNPNCQKC